MTAMNRDEEHILRLARSLQAGAAFERGVPSVEDMTHEERKRCVSRKGRNLLFTAVVVAAFMTYLEMRPESAKPPVPVAAYESVGLVDAIQVHYSTFTVDSTVTTSGGGVYQVHGAVSATAGDNVRVRRYDSGAQAEEHSPHLCIESRASEVCYKLR